VIECLGPRMLGDSASRPTPGDGAGARPKPADDAPSSDSSRSQDSSDEAR
jgi:hypothetical protein